MRILIDAIGAPQKSGGMEVWARELIGAWAQQFPDDKIVVIAQKKIYSQAPVLGVRVLDFPLNNKAGRALGQLLLTPLIFKTGGFSKVLVLNSVLSPFLWSCNATIINHDWRHLHNPEEFSFFERIYRRIWVSSSLKSRHVVAISSHTAAFTADLTGRRDIKVVAPGGDHLDRVAEDDSLGYLFGGVPFLLTYGQHSNKRPELGIAALSEIHQRFGLHSLNLVVLGATGKRLQLLKDFAISEGVAGSTIFLEHVSLSQYKWLLGNCQAVLMLSTHEGFGIPVFEAMEAGKTVIVSNGVGVVPHSPSTVLPVSNDVVELSNTIRDSLGKSAHPRCDTRTWVQTAIELRRVIGKLH